MISLRYILVVSIALILFWWPIICLVKYFRYKRRVSKLTKNLSVCDDYPFFGSALRFMGKNSEEMMNLLKHEYTNQKMPLVTWMGPKCFIVVDHPDDIQVIMNSKSCIEKSDIYRFFNRGVGLFSAPAHIWRPQRKRLAMSFNNQICWSFLPIFNQKANIFVHNIGKHIGKGNFNIMEYSSAWALDVVCDTVLGTPMNIQNGENMHFVKALTDWLAAVTRRIANVFLHPDFVYKKTQLYQKECEAIAISEAVQEKIILKKIHEFNEANSSGSVLGDEDEETEFESPQIFINRLIKLRCGGIITDQAIRDQVYLIIFAGQDTSSYTIAMTILLLTIHPKVEQLVIDELNQALGVQPIDSDLTMDQVNRLGYLEQVIKETLRLYPVAPFLIRHCTEDTKLSDCVIPADTGVVISSFTAHRRKDIWGVDADQFNPDHFGKEENSKRNPFAFMAFSNGPRNCIGQRFAFISIKITLAKLLRKYKFATPLKMDDLRFQLEITSKLINGIVVEAEERK